MAQIAFLKKRMEEKKAPVGFSWTTLLFGFWVALFRKDWRWAGGMFIVFFMLNFLGQHIIQQINQFGGEMPAELVPLAMFYIVLSLGLSIYFAFIYNKKYTQKLLDQGFQPADGYSAELLKNYGLVVKNTSAPTIENNFFQP